MYYRLYDEQTGRYMGTGYNAESKKELIEDYIGYKSIDWDKDTVEYYKSLSEKAMISIIEDDEFVIEKSKTKFKEEY